MRRKRSGHEAWQAYSEAAEVQISRKRSGTAGNGRGNEEGQLQEIRFGYGKRKRQRP